MIPAGTHRGYAVQALLAETKAGDGQVVIECAFQDPELAEHLTYYGSFKEKAFDFTIRALRACGWKGDDLNDLSTVGQTEVDLVVVHDEYEGKTRAKIAFINEPGAIAFITPMTGDRAKAFAAQMKGRIAASSASSASSAAKPNGAKPAPKVAAARVGQEPPPPSDSDRPPF